MNPELMQTKHVLTMVHSYHILIIELYHKAFQFNSRILDWLSIFAMYQNLSCLNH